MMQLVSLILVSLILVAAPTLADAAYARTNCGNLCNPRFMHNATTNDIRRQLHNGANLHAQDGRGATPLHWAARLNTNPAVIDLLIRNGAMLNAREALFAATPLHWAAYHNPNPAIAALLLAHGAVLNKGDRDKRTPLYWATVRANTAP